MKAGKVEYAPDYKSQVQLAMDEGRRIAESVIVTNKFNSEHARLKDAVVEAVKAWRVERLRIETTASPFERLDLSIDANIELFKPVDALLAFEAEHKIGVE